ncbi:hypothetical protein GOBAR_DD05098 [Gossypium barbadense]|nr:hypothetical protein GOBAR_DD05098 [Gossypium barbadense]
MKENNGTVQIQNMLVLMYILAVSGGGEVLSVTIEPVTSFGFDLHPVFSHADHDDFTWTPMDGVISSLLLDLRHLSHLDLSRNQFTKIPGFVGSLKDNNNGDMISDNLEWHSGLSSLRTFKLSRTNLTMAVNWLHSIKAHPSLSSLYLQDCQFPGVDPSSLSHINSSKSLAVLQLIDSIVHPSTFPLLLNMSNKLTALHLSKNHLNGIIPISFAHMGSSLGNLRKLRTLLLNGNYINEPLPVILEKPSGCVKDSLQVLDLSVNQIKGSLPEIITRFSSLKELCPDDNKLDGALPDNVGNLSSLAVLNLVRNKLTGSLPQSIGLMSGLKVLDVSSNSFNDFTSEIHFLKLSKLKFLTLSFNSLSLNFSSRKGSSNATIKYTILYSNTIWDGNGGTSDHSAATYTGYASVVWKVEVGQLRAPESLDLSTNRLSGEIPLSLADCSFLSCLNLSNNNLSGKIPLSTQLQSFLVESYMGNVGLCGLPLNSICPEDEKQQDGGVEHSNLDDEKLYKGSGFYVGLIIGFTLGFWGLCWTLLFNWPGKPASFPFFDNMVDWLSLKMALNIQQPKSDSQCSGFLATYQLTNNVATANTSNRYNNEI